MTIVEKAAYLKGLTEGLGVEADSKEGKLWGALCDLVSDMAHEIEDLQQCNLDYADVLDEIGDELSYLEELTCDLDMDEWDEDDDDDDDDDDVYHFSSYDDDDDDDDEELEYDGVLYDVTCPVCGEEITFDEDTLEEGSVECPNCGEELEFDLDGITDEDDDKKDD